MTTAAKQIVETVAASSPFGIVRLAGLAAGLSIALCPAITAQRIAVVAPAGNAPAASYADALHSTFPKDVRLIDREAAETAIASLGLAQPFNLSSAEAANAGKVVGCDIMLLVRADTVRRSSFERPVYWEAYAAVYLVSCRTGRLALWRLSTNTADDASEAETLLRSGAASLAVDVAGIAAAAFRGEVYGPEKPRLEELPAPDLNASKDFRPPVPFRRIKPEYTDEAFLYDVRATVEIEVDIDASGAITRTEIVRWAGFGLENSVEKAVRSMNWRPAERNGRPLPMRVVLRYNFTKVPKDDDPPS